MARKSATATLISSTISPTRVLVVQDHPLLASAIARVLESQEDMCVCGIARGGEEAAVIAASEKPSVVLMDVALDGIEATRKMREFPDGPAGVLMASEDEEIDDRAVEAGAAAYVRKGTDLLALVDVVAAFAGLDGQAKPKDHPID